MRAAWREARSGNPDDLLAIGGMAAMCWAVIVFAVSGWLALFGVVTFRDPAGRTIALIALGPFGLGVLGMIATAPFFALKEKLGELKERDDGE